MEQFLDEAVASHRDPAQETGSVASSIERLGSSHVRISGPEMRQATSGGWFPGWTSSLGGLMNAFSVARLSGSSWIPSTLGLLPILVFLWGCSTTSSPTDPGSSSPSGNPDPGSIQVNTLTSGDDLDPDGYQVALGSQSRSIGANASVTFSNLSAGTSFNVTLSGVAGNCAVAGGNSQMSGQVRSNQTIQVSFSISCSALTGSLQVTTATSGSGTDVDGYVVTVGGTNRSMDMNDTVIFNALSPGDYDVQLGELDAQCLVSGTNPLTVTVQAGATASAAFAVQCEAPPVGPIVFSTTRGGGGLMAVEPDGSGLQRLTDRGLDPAWSPDGEHIVFAAMMLEDSYRQLYRMTKNGEGVTRLTNDNLNHFFPAWSPDGSRIAYTRPDYYQEIYVIDAEGSGAPVNITNTANLHERHPDWSPDGNTLVFTLASSSGNLGLHTLDMTDPAAVPQQLTSGRDEEPVWSPDGSKIAFSRRDGFIVELWVIDMGSHVETRITQGENERHPSWSPDGQYLTFVSDRGEDGEHIWKVEVASGTFTQLTSRDQGETGTEENPTWRW